MIKIKLLGIFTAFKYYFYTFLEIKKIIKIKILKKDIYIRTSTPDLNVAIMCFTEEYKNIKDYVVNQYPNLIIDAGGYIGTAAIKLSEIFPKSKIITLEPSTKNYEILLKNIKNYKNIYPIKSALVASKDSMTVNLRDRLTGEWGYSLVEEPLDQENSKIIEAVNTITLSDIKKKFNLKIDILKLDIEGGEKNIFENCKNDINEINTIIVELHERIIINCLKSFKEACKNKIIKKMSYEKYIAHSNLKINF
jgi:FkbM family methyltransferase